WCRLAGPAEWGLAGAEPDAGPAGVRHTRRIRDLACGVAHLPAGDHHTPVSELAACGVTQALGSRWRGLGAARSRVARSVAALAWAPGARRARRGPRILNRSCTRLQLTPAKRPSMVLQTIAPRRCADPDACKAQLDHVGGEVLRSPTQDPRHATE